MAGFSNFKNLRPLQNRSIGRYDYEELTYTYGQHPATEHT